MTEKANFVSSLKTEIYEFGNTSFFAEVISTYGTQTNSHCINIINGQNYDDRLCVFATMYPKERIDEKHAAEKEISRFLNDADLCIRLWRDVREP